MSGRGWSYEAVRRIFMRSKREDADPETVLVDELIRYLEGKPGTFSDVASSSVVISLQGIQPSISLYDDEQESGTRLDDMKTQASALGVDMLEMLELQVHMGNLNLADALILAFQYGSQVNHLVERMELRQNRYNPSPIREEQVAETRYEPHQRHQRTSQVVEAHECTESSIHR